jgi:hypothetical protein
VALETGDVVEDDPLGRLDASAFWTEQDNCLRGVGTWDEVRMGQK